MTRARDRLASLPRRDRLLLPAVAVLVLAVVAALAAPLLSSHDPTAVDYGAALSPPGPEHLLGTDDFGRDVLTRLIHGGRASLTAASLAVSVVVVVGTVVGAVSALVGGVLDVLLTRVVDVLLAFPRLVLAIAIAAFVGAGLGGLVLALSVVSWPGYARIVRGLVLQVRQEGYVVAARAAGTPPLRILRTHVLGAISGPILVLALVDFGEIVLGVAALSFLGLGIAPPVPEWGAMLNESRSSLEVAPWTFLAPGLAILVVVLAINHVGDSLRDALDPRETSLPAPPRWRDRHGGPARRARVARMAAGPDAVGAPLVLVEDLRVAVGDTTILDAVSLRIDPGECVGLVGESGSGKSTLAAALLGLVRPPLRLAGGEISLLGEPVAALSWQDWRPIRGRHVALVSQDPMNALNPVLRIDTQVVECGTAHGMSVPEARHRAAEVLEAVGLPATTGRLYPHQLSGGMRQRVVIAMALVNRPRVIVADEPTTALDVSTQAGVLAELSGLRSELGLGLLFVSHDLRLVAGLADRVAVLREGRIVEQAPTAEVFGSPRAEYTRELIAAVPRVPGEVVHG